MRPCRSHRRHCRRPSNRGDVLFAGRAGGRALAEVERVQAREQEKRAARAAKLKAGKKVQMANRRMVGLLKMIRNVAFAHRSQNVQV